jgi:hypothetical protein
MRCRDVRAGVQEAGRGSQSGSNRRRGQCSTGADTINAEGRYRKKDGSAVTSSQIAAQVGKYPQLFGRTGDGPVQLRRESR